MGVKMKEIVCPISFSNKLVKLEIFSVKDVVELYDQIFDVNIASEFKGLNEVTLYHCPTSDLIFFHPAVTGSEKFYETLQSIPNYYVDDKEEYHYAKKWVKSSDLVLEIGCGKASFVKYINPTSYCGLEYSPIAIEMARSNGYHILQESIESHSLTCSESYDVVCAFQVLEHISQISSFVKSSIQCLKPGGILIYSVPSHSSFISEIPNFILDMPPHHITQWSDTALRNLGELNHLKFLDLWHEPLQKYHVNLYIETKIRTFIYKLFGIHFKPINKSFLYKIINSLILICVKLLPLKKAINRVEILGHTVVAVYQKPT
jgi:SAM-dependent methyltransferase